MIMTKIFFATTFTKSWSWQIYIFISALGVLPLSYFFYFSAMFTLTKLWQKIPLLLPHSLHCNHAKRNKNISFISALHALILWTWQKICTFILALRWLPFVLEKIYFSFHFSTTFSLCINYDWKYIYFHSSTTLTMW